MNILLKVFAFAFLILATSLAVSETAADNPVFKKLSDRRNEVIFPAYSVEDRQLIVSQVELVLNELFVHRLLKIQDFGESANPAPALQAVKDSLSATTDQVFHQQIAHIFYSVRDLHTAYKFPKPYACYSTILPFTLTSAEDNAGQSVIAVNAVLKTDEVLALIPQASKISLGDVLVSFDGMPAKDAALQMAATGMGANPAAWLKRGINRLVVRSQARVVVPEKNTVKVVFKNRLGQTYALELPWLSKANNDCLKPATQPSFKNKAELRGVDQEQLEFQEIFRRAQKSRLWALTPTAEPIFSYALVENENGSYGILRLDSFTPTKLSLSELILLVKSIVSENFQNTNGIIFDLRNNGGGQIYLGEALAQLFTMNFVDPLGFQFLNSSANQFLASFNYFPTPHANALKRAQLTGAGMTDPVPLSTASSINQIGQFYFKPVAVLTNSACYSSCDVATSVFQDSAGVTIWTEDGNTGGGGANNVQHSEVLEFLIGKDQGPFRALPGSQEIGFAWRQMVRTGKNAGKLIEDSGIIGDRLLPLTIEDLYSDGRRQIKIISQELAAKNQNFQSMAKLQNNDRVDVDKNTVLQIPLLWTQTAAIEIFQNNKSVSLFKTPSPNVETFKVLTLPDNLIPKENSIGRYELVGFNAGQRVWRKIFNFRVVPGFTLFSQEHSFSLARNEDSPLINIFNDHPATISGWTLKDGRLVVADGYSYEDNVHSEASFFLDLVGRTSLTLNLVATINTEKDFDYFKVIVLDSAGPHVLESASGELGERKFEYDLSAYVGQKIELRLLFTSDAGVINRGVQITGLSID